MRGRGQRGEVQPGMHPLEPAGWGDDRDMDVFGQSVLHYCRQATLKLTCWQLQPGRVRVAVRLRPRNAEDVLTDSDYADCVEMQPECPQKVTDDSNGDETFVLNQ
nr:Armadillo repeat-containing kinesin-like protein 1 [Ipomoea batatas]